MTDGSLTDPIDDLLDVLDLTWEGSTTIRAVAPEGLAGEKIRHRGAIMPRTAAAMH